MFSTVPQTHPRLPFDSGSVINRKAVAPTVGRHCILFVQDHALKGRWAWSAIVWEPILPPRIRVSAYQCIRASVHPRIGTVRILPAGHARIAYCRRATPCVAGVPTNPLGIRLGPTLPAHPRIRASAYSHAHTPFPSRTRPAVEPRHAWRGADQRSVPTAFPLRTDQLSKGRRGWVCGGVSRMGRAYTPDGLGRSPTPVLPCAQDSAHVQAATEPPGTDLRRPPQTHRRRPKAEAPTDQGSGR
jgi:hypothetical protein